MEKGKAVSPNGKVYAARLRNVFTESVCVRFSMQTKFKIITIDMFAAHSVSP